MQKSAKKEKERSEWFSFFFLFLSFIIFLHLSLVFYIAWSWLFLFLSFFVFLARFLQYIKATLRKWYDLKGGFVYADGNINDLIMLYPLLSINTSRNDALPSFREGSLPFGGFKASPRQVERFSPCWSASFPFKLRMWRNEKNIHCPNSLHSVIANIFPAKNISFVSDPSYWIIVRCKNKTLSIKISVFAKTVSRPPFFFHCVAAFADI